MAFQRGVAGEGPVTVAADVAVHACMDLHVLLQSLLGREPLCTQQTEHRHVCPWRQNNTQTGAQLFQSHIQTARALSGGNWVPSTFFESSEEKASFNGQVLRLPPTLT